MSKINYTLIGILIGLSGSFIFAQAIQTQETKDIPIKIITSKEELEIKTPKNEIIDYTTEEKQLQQLFQINEKLGNITKILYEKN